MLTHKQTQDVVDEGLEITETMQRLIHDEYKSAGYGTRTMDDQAFLGWIAINMKYHGEDVVPMTDEMGMPVIDQTGQPQTQRVMADPTRFFRALANCEGGMKEIARFKRIMGGNDGRME